MLGLKKRMIEEFEWKLAQEKAQLAEEYFDKYNTQCETFEKALEIQQDIYDRKIKHLEEAVEAAYDRGRKEVLELVKEKISTGKLTYIRKRK